MKQRIPNLLRIDEHEFSLPVKQLSEMIFNPEISQKICQFRCMQQMVAEITQHTDPGAKPPIIQVDNNGLLKLKKADDVDGSGASIDYATLCSRYREIKKTVQVDSDSSISTSGTESHFNSSQVFLPPPASESGPASEDAAQLSEEKLPSVSIKS